MTGNIAEAGLLQSISKRTICQLLRSKGIMQKASRILWQSLNPPLRSQTSILPILRKPIQTYGVDETPFIRVCFPFIRIVFQCHLRSSNSRLNPHSGLSGSSLPIREHRKGKRPCFSGRISHKGDPFPFSAYPIPASSSLSSS